MQRGFTLIELLVVIAILGVLSTAVVLVLNPAELLKQGRDSTRLSDLAALQSSLALFQADQWNQSLGAASTTYLSIPDSSPTCQNTGILPPPGWTYRCAPLSTYAKTDGSGWIPLNFTLISAGSPLSKLPIDPINTTSSGLYYTYTPGGSYAISGMLESAKYLPMAAGDQGYDPGRYEAGSDISLIAKSEGLVGWWPLDESANDMSGNGNQGTLSSPPPTWVSGKVGGAGSFNGTSNMIQIGNSFNSLLNLRSPIPPSFTVSAWFLKSDWNGGELGGITLMGSSARLCFRASAIFLFQLKAGSNGATSNAQLNTWYNAVGVYDSNADTMKLYVNGQLAGTVTPADRDLSAVSPQFMIGNAGQYYEGLIDDVRIYNRALSAAEIQTMYNAEK